MTEHYLLTKEELSQIIDLTERIGDTGGWVKEVQPVVNERMKLLNEVLSRPAPTHKTNMFFAPMLDCDCEVCKDAREAHDTVIRNAECKRISTEITRILRDHPARTINRLFLQELEESLRGEKL